MSVDSSKNEKKSFLDSVPIIDGFSGGHYVTGSFLCFGAGMGQVDNDPDDMVKREACLILGHDPSRDVIRIIRIRYAEDVSPEKVRNIIFERKTETSTEDD